MIKPNEFLEFLHEKGIDFFAGVPDSLLKSFCACITDQSQLGVNHFITPHEGLAVSLATGYHLSTGKVPLVYMQNSGIGNTVNPATSLTHQEIYGIPILYIVGWRGQPGFPDEPQHLIQGRITPDLLELVGISTLIIKKTDTISEIKDKLATCFEKTFRSGRSLALVIEKGAFDDYSHVKFQNEFSIVREEAISAILENVNQKDVIVGTTGKISREVYDYRKFNHESHEQDFLTVGSMGHSSMIALGIAINQPERNIYCLDGDGATLMHLGSLVLIGNTGPKNLVHIVLNNSAYESVGGQPTIVNNLSLCELALNCGYGNAFMIEKKDDIPSILSKVNFNDGPNFIDIHVSVSSRKDLSRPANSPNENKKLFMNFLQSD